MEIVRRVFVFGQRSIWYLPLVSALWFWVYVLLMAYVLGHFPQYDVDPMSTPGLDWFYDSVHFLFAAGFFSGAACLVYLVLKLFFRKMPVHFYDVVFLVFGIALFILNFQTSEMEWFLD